MRKILIVEDDQPLAKLYEKELKEKEFVVELAFDGKQAYQQIVKNQPLPNLLLVDLMLPKLVGIDLIRQLKQEELTKKIPIFVLTNFNQPHLIKQAFDFEVVDYFLKYKISPSEVAERLKDFANRLPPL